MPGWSTMSNIGFSDEQRASPSTSSVNVWYGPQHTSWASKISPTSARVRLMIHGLRTEPMTSRAANRPPSSDRSTPSSFSIWLQASEMPVASTRFCHWRGVSPTTMIRLPSLVAKSRPKAP